MSVSVMVFKAYLFGLHWVNPQALHEPEHLIVWLVVRRRVRGAPRRIRRRRRHGVRLHRHPPVLLYLVDRVPLHWLQNQHLAD